jgi:hypothetical protein
MTARSPPCGTLEHGLRFPTVRISQMMRSLQMGLQDIVRRLGRVVAGGSRGASGVRRRARRPAGSVRPALETLEDRTLLSVAIGDFNGDGIADLVQGMPSAKVGGVGKAGAVTISYGSAAGVPAQPQQFLTLNSLHTGQTAKFNTQFGFALAVGDFNGDGYADLAIGDPYEAAGGCSAAGQVHVLYGGPNGLQIAGSQSWQQGVNGLPHKDHVGDHFGYALAAGDFNGAVNPTTGLPIDDLAVGMPDNSGGPANVLNCGGVIIIYGSTSGLTGVNSRNFDSTTDGIVGGPQVAEHWGTALAAGDFNGDGYADLAVGIPDKAQGPNLSATSAGAVNIIYGSAAGLTTTGDQLWNQSTVNDGQAIQPGARFGSSLVAGDFNHDGMADLAIGVPLEDLGSLTDAGAVNVLYGSSTGLDTAGSQFLTQGSLGGTDQAGAQFGAALAAGHFNSDGAADLAIGAPFASVGTLANAGTVSVVYGSSLGLGTAGNQVWTEGLLANGHASEGGGEFGNALAAGGLNGLGFSDLAIEVPGHHGAVPNAGAVDVLFGGGGSLTATGSQFRADSLFAPTPLTAAPQSGTSIALTWQVNSTNQTGFLIERSTDGVHFTQVASVGATANTYTDTGLSLNTAYYYRVRATNAAGTSAYSEVVSVLTPPLEQPTNLTATATGPFQINLTWTDNSTGELGFLIERSKDGKHWTQIAVVGPGVTSYLNNKGLASGVTYYYRVRAYNSIGDSLYSDIATATTL